MVYNGAEDDIKTQLAVKAADMLKTEGIDAIVMPQRTIDGFNDI